MVLDEWLDYPDPYADYLTADELYKETGLLPSDLARLDSARLLLPDHGGKYRPKLVGWSRKLAYLLAQGWEIEEIKHWARWRWAAPNPREWPPIREDWQD